MGTCCGHCFLWVWQYRVGFLLSNSMISPKTHVPYVEERICWQLGSRSTAHLMSTRCTPNALCLGYILQNAASKLRSACQDDPGHERELHPHDFRNSMLCYNIEDFLNMVVLQSHIFFNPDRLSTSDTTETCRSSPVPSLQLGEHKTFPKNIDQPLQKHLAPRHCILDRLETLWVLAAWLLRLGLGVALPAVMDG